MLGKLIWRIRLLLENLLNGPGGWGWLRLAGVILAVVAFARLDRFVWSEPGAPLTPFLTRGGLRYLVCPSFAVLGAFLIGGWYLKRLYELPGQRQANRYLFSAAFGIAYPSLKIQDGQKILETGQVNLLDVIGGPGYLRIQPGSAVVLESLVRPTNVYGTGEVFVSRLERIRETINLAEQVETIAALPIITVDGIPVVVRDIHYRYRLRSDHRPGQPQPHGPANPYPVLPAATREVAYRRTANARGVMSWTTMVRNGPEGAVQNYVRAARLDAITIPDADLPDPRARAEGQVRRAAANSIKPNGAELLWMDMGHVDPSPDDVRKLQAEAWGETWKGQATVNRAEADGQRIRLQELGRAEAQAEMLTSLVEALGNLDLTQSPRENLRTLIIMRTAQILEAMSEKQQPRYRDFEALSHQPPHALGGRDEHP